MTTFTDDDLEKQVENANGEVIGTVTDVDGETALIQPRSGMVDSIKAALGWRQNRQETMTIRGEAVDEITPETVRLEATPMDGTTDASTTAAADQSSTDSDAMSPADQRGEAESPTGSDDRMAGPDSEPEPDRAAENPDRDRGIATGDSARGLETGDPNDDLATGEPARSADGVHEPIGSATPPEPGDGPIDEGGTERERDREPGRSSERETTDDSHDWSDGPSSETATESEPESEPEDQRSSPIEPLTSSDIDGNGRNETTDTDGDAAADADENAASASDSRSESDDGSIDIADATATERPNRVDEPAIDDPVPEPETDPATESTDTGETDADGEPTTLVDESNVGSGPRSLEDVGGTDDDTEARSNDEERNADTAATEGNLADEVNRGVDIESAVDDANGSVSSVDEVDANADGEVTAPDADSTNPADELEMGLDLEAAVEPAESDDVATDSTVEKHRDEGDDPAVEIEPGIDAASAMESTESTSASDGEAEPKSEPAGQRVDVDTGPETAMHRALTDEDAPATDDSDSDERPEPSSERPERPTDDDSRDRSGANSTAIAPITATAAAQRLAFTTNRTAAKLAATAQRNATRTALAGPLFAQRGTLEFAQTAARSYTNGVAAMMEMGMETTGREQDDAKVDAEQSMDEALAGLEDRHPRIEDEELNRELAAHLERVRELQSTAAFDRRERIERATELLERQTELLRQCQQHLEDRR